MQKENICMSINLWTETFTDVILGKLCVLMVTLHSAVILNTGPLIKM